MNKKLLPVIFFVYTVFLNPFSSYGQWQNELYIGKQANHWYFGKHEGLDFNTSPPTQAMGQISPYGTVLGGTGAMADGNGDLLFYSDGTKIWNKNHEIMENGSGLHGQAHAMQNGLIVPIPGQPERYYVFTLANPLEQVQTGLSYSEIDMSLSGGLGAVTANKNIQLATLVASKISATYNQDRSSIWVLCHLLDGNEFAAFEITAAGINSTPVISAVGVEYFIDFQDETGQLKFSPDGTKVAISNPYITRNLQVFDFDKETGILSEPFLTMDVEFTGGMLLGPFGLEFSPNSQLLYVNEGDDLLGVGYSRLHQINLAAGDEQAIKASDIIIKEYYYNPAVPTAPYMNMGGMQLSPEGKIYLRPMTYRPNGGYINVIHYPNNIGLAADYQQDAPVAPGMVPPGPLSYVVGWFPSFVQDFFASGILHTPVTCNHEATFSLLRIPGITATAWNFGDPTSTANESQLLAPTHTFSAPGTYTVTVQITSNGGVQTASIQVVVPGISIGAPEDMTVCTDEDSESFDLAAHNELILDGQEADGFEITYHTTQGDAQTGENAISTPDHFESAGQTIYVRLEDAATGCYKNTEFDLVLFKNPALPDGFEIEGCSTFDLRLFDHGIDGDPAITFHTSPEDAQAGTNTIADVADYTFAGDTAVVYARGVDANGCYSIAPIRLVQAECFIPKGISPNHDGRNDAFDLSFLAREYGITTLTIYNRYGTEVYQQKNYTNQWSGQASNGNLLPSATYYYVIAFDKAHPEFGHNISSWVYIQREN